MISMLYFTTVWKKSKALGTFVCEIRLFDRRNLKRDFPICISKQSMVEYQCHIVKNGILWALVFGPPAIPRM